MVAKSWFSRCWQRRIGGCVAIAGTLAIATSTGVLAQIVPDTTLGAEGSVVTPNANVGGLPADLIQSGARRGANLFHSFSDFNVGNLQRVYFANPAGVQNILSRVTGTTLSNILGTLGVDGTANLFLINPNGIVFGPNASLDVQGSFLATTANAVKLGDDGLFSASQPATSNLLSVSPSALWFNAVAAQPIFNRSRAPSSFGQRNSVGLNPGLQVRSGRTLALVGGDVLLEGGRLTAAQGRIELGSVAGMGQVSLTQSGNSLVLGYDTINSFGNIRLSNGAFVDASGAGGGDIQIRGARSELTQGSRIRANTLGAGDGGQLTVTATDGIEVSGSDPQGNSSSIRAEVNPGGTGKGGNLTLKTAQLSLRQGGQISVSTFGTGDGGQLTVNATAIELIGDNPINGSPSVLLAAVGPSATGNGGNVTIQTQSLRILDGATLSASTLGRGNGGQLTVTTTDGIEVSGSGPQGNSSSIAAQVNPGATGKGGNLTLKTAQLSLSQGGQISVSTFGTGDAGQLTVNATAIELVGDNPINGNPSGLFADVARNARGNGGDVVINTGRLLVRDGAVISSGSSGTGTAGNINITARDTLQANNGTIATSSDPSSGGGITITASNIRLFGNSDITSRVNSGAGGGGNIYLKAGSILAFGDNDILAFARDGRGGNITLDTRAFFVQNYRPAPRGTDPRTLDGNNRVDINATGTVTILLPDTTFQNSLSELPENRIDTNALLATSCIVRRNQPTQGSFTITGAGGLPQRPGDVQMSSFPTVDVETLPSDGTPSSTNPNRPWQKSDPIVEPQGVYRLPNGKLVMSRECPDAKL